VVDPAGRRLGYDPATGQVVNEIPIGLYQHPVGGTLDLWIFDPLPGNYSLTISGTSSGNYTVLAQFVDSVAAVPVFFDKSAILPGEVRAGTLVAPNASNEVAYPPDVQAGPDLTANKGASLTFNGYVTDINPGEAYTYRWNFGDGTASVEGTLNPTHSYTVVGAYTVTLTVTDSAGFEVSDTLTANILYTFAGFFPPVDNPPTLNVAKAGSAIPMKFSLGGYQGVNILAAGYPTSTTATCGSTAEDAIEETVTASSSGLSYDASTDQYVYVWKTDKTWANTCRTLVVKLNDGTYHRANFKFKP
jgi:hypothetical protein